ncbi:MULTISPECIES: DUF4388 domain-containing protein [unclassified Coleofasciculus]|uniref:DUF4388 domain-containing protein n=1 Tax=unclassified Coleofasciculus TaxID=2692782 RepID=UPI00187E253B|nr:MULTISPECIES: DUF4388 domain-containing protein [unclassified Coleofasciculus]MBE9128423.1 DUF4388 domain-containing protein [Coleofasciculus sp. LEGE 07081]MBE9149532.1 DUF4388 domain-containing protein [Coleofasciculus sp. LEGE 07092]
MSIIGFLSDFSLPEIFRFIDSGSKTGMLTLRVLPESSPASHHYIWVENGSIVAAASELNENGLLSLIQQYQWVSDRVVTKLAQLRPADQPLGLYLRKQGVLRAEQLEHLFQVQLVQQFCVLFKLKDAHFKFEQNAPFPTQEMTGLSLPVTVVEVLLQKFVVLKQLFVARRIRQEKNGLNTKPDMFCHQIGLTMDIAFFHSLHLSLFETDYTLADLAQIVELYYRPYDIPKSKFASAMS